MNLKNQIITYLTENPTHNKGDIIHHFNLNITNSTSEESKKISYYIWCYNHNNNTSKNYSLIPTQS